MKKSISVAVYTGVTKNPTFIQRLIDGLASDEMLIHIYGVNNGSIVHQKNVKYYVYKQKWQKLWMLLKYRFLLVLFKSKEKRKLDQFIATKEKKKHLLQLKYYPVLYHKPDIFHVQWAKGIADWVWVKDFGIKLVLSLRGAHINYSPIVDSHLAETYRKFFPMVSGFHAVSDAIALETTKYEVNLSKINVIKSGLRINDFEFTIRSFDSGTELNIVSVGRNHWKKNYRMALDVMSSLKQNNVKFSYTIIGVADSEELIFQRSQLGLIDEVRFFDVITFNEVRNLVIKSDVMLLSSVEEGIANVVLEAMALGTLVVATDCGGMREVVINNETGFLVPNRDEKAMVDTLIKVSKLTTNEYSRIIGQARKFIEQHHNNDQMISKMQSLYYNVIAEDL